VLTVAYHALLGLQVVIEELRGRQGHARGRAARRQVQPLAVAAVIGVLAVAAHRLRKSRQ